MNKITVLSLLEDDALSVYNKVKTIDEEENWYSSFGTAKKLYESDSDYKALVDEWESIQSEFSPRIRNFLQKELAVRGKWASKKF